MISVPFKLYTNTSAAGFLITSAVYDPEEQTAAAVLSFFLVSINTLQEGTNAKYLQRWPHSSPQYTVNHNSV